MSFLNELKRRNVFRAGAAYIVTAWLVVQVVETLFPIYGLGAAAVRTVVNVLGIGLLPVLILSWVFEWTPQGLKKDADVAGEPVAATQAAKSFDRIILIVFALALGYFAFDKFVLDPERDAADIEAATEVAVEQAFAEAAAAQPANSIAVLPFDNRSNLEEDQFFTDGMHDDLLTTIAKIGSMKVISRTSVMEYKDTLKKIPAIAKELGVANILEGGIQRSGGQVRINIQLIDAITDEHLWAETYDRALTPENLFAVQSEITKAIADALNTTLSAEETLRIDAILTKDIVAYDAYLLGRQLMANRESEKLQMAIDSFTKAIELDPEFALAWVGLADSTRLHTRYSGQSYESTFLIRENAVHKALAIDGNSGEAYTSLGAIYSDKGLDEEADVAFRKAIELSPNYATAWQWYAEVVSRDPRLSDEKIRLLQTAVELDPRSSIIRLNLANSYRFRGLYSMAERQYLKMVDQNPEFQMGIWTVGGFYGGDLGRFDKASEYVLKALKLNPQNLGTLYQLLDIYLNLDDFASAEQILARMNDIDSSHEQTVSAELALAIHKNNMTGAREVLKNLTSILVNVPRQATFLGFWDLVLGNTDRAREHYLRVNPLWLDPHHEQHPDDLFRDGCNVAWILSNTGDIEAGQAVLKQTLFQYEEVLSGNTEHVDATQVEVCYLAAGNIEKALEQIETKLAHNHLYDWKLNHLLPMYDPIRHEPRFLAAIAERERLVAIQREAVHKKGLFLFD
jgi:TolB-like protein/Tfp pilus assembly protein PilF